MVKTNSFRKEIELANGNKVTIDYNRKTQRIEVEHDGFALMSIREGLVKDSSHKLVTVIYSNSANEITKCNVEELNLVRFFGEVI